MERFYMHLKHSDSIVKSLRETKLEMIQSDVLSHPYYWAGFIISGKADQVIFPKPYKAVFILLGILLVVSTAVILYLKIPSHFSKRSASASEGR
jgi:hypothetical protein